MRASFIEGLEEKLPLLSFFQTLSSLSRCDDYCASYNVIMSSRKNSVNWFALKLSAIMNVQLYLFYNRDQWQEGKFYINMKAPHTSPIRLMNYCISIVFERENPEQMRFQTKLPKSCYGCNRMNMIMITQNV